MKQKAKTDTMLRKSQNGREMVKENSDPNQEFRTTSC
jgi:hypothetical protein